MNNPSIRKIRTVRVNGRGQFVIPEDCAVTSNLEAKKYSIPISQQNLMNGRLPIKSRIRADKILQIEKRLIVKPFAAIDSQTFATLISELTALVKRGS